MYHWLSNLSHAALTLGVLKPFFNKTANRFVETGYLPVIGLCDIMCHVAAVLERKAAGEVKRGYIITTSTVCVN